MILRSRQDDRRQPATTGGQGLEHQDLERDKWKLGGGTTWGWYSYDPKLNLIYLRDRQSGEWNPDSAAGRQPAGR